MLISKQPLSRNTPCSSDDEYQTVSMQKQNPVDGSRHLKRSSTINESEKKQKNHQDSDISFIDIQQNQTLDYKQLIDYATRMEKARTRLLNLLVQTPESLKIFANHYMYRIEQGLDQSEIFSFSYGKNHTDPEHENSFVQDNAKQFGAKLDALCREIIANVETEIKLHDISVHDKKYRKLI